MLCPHCFHYGSDDREYPFDRELYCGICAQQFPRREQEWLDLFRGMAPEWYEHVEHELNKIGASKSGLDPHTRERLAGAVDAFAALRLSGPTLSDQEYAAWLRFACAYYAPGG